MFNEFDQFESFHLLEIFNLKSKSDSKNLKIWIQEAFFMYFQGKISNPYNCEEATALFLIRRRFYLGDHPFDC